MVFFSPIRYGPLDSGQVTRLATRIGSSLVELLGVIFVIGLIYSLVFSATHLIREKVQKTSCLNHLKQIGMGLQGHHDSLNVFPQGTVPGSRENSLFPYLSWRALILAHIDQDNLAKAIPGDYGLSADPFTTEIGKVHQGPGKVITLYGCPSDSRLTTSWVVTLGDGKQRYLGMSSYLGINGTHHLNGDGNFFLGSKTRLSDILDGTSNTIIVGERPPSINLVYGWWYAGTGWDFSGAGDAHLGVAETNPGYQYYLECPFGPYSWGETPSNTKVHCREFSFWSLHGRGSHFLFADGSVKWIQNDNRSILKSLATIQGGELE